MVGTPSAVSVWSGFGADVLSLPSCGGGAALFLASAILCHASLSDCGAVVGEGVAGVGVVGWTGD